MVYSRLYDTACVCMQELNMSDCGIMAAGAADLAYTLARLGYVAGHTVC